ncbi:glycosyltransferase family 8 protein [Helicobacter sp. 11S02596-1]|uniref:glycosyltransferase family 8 protein n=1 Tax=Helicobacter sp. 11S02596-1 TaxID=1476194 RepID=UPI00117B52AB|nr:glycosyltransferase family 8 protein [Helicobacter sp. 11S02596-1]
MAQETNNPEIQIIPLMFCFDKNYAIPASVAFYSLLKNTKPISMGGGADPIQTLCPPQ